MYINAATDGQYEQYTGYTVYTLYNNIRADNDLAGRLLARVWHLFIFNSLFSN